MREKVLFCASTASHLLNFHLPYLKAFQEKGFEVWAAAANMREIPYADHTVELPFQKSMFSFSNVKAVFQARRLLKEQGFSLVSLHTMLASAVVRAAVLLLKKRPKVVNTVHGYLFGEASGAKKWAYLIPEKLCARVTDATMVMNEEDLRLAEKYRLAGKKLVKVRGMGLELSRYRALTATEKTRRREELGYSGGDVLAVYAAEFSNRKNQALLLRAFAQAARVCPRLRLILAGSGANWEACKKLASELGLTGKVDFPGYLPQMEDWYPVCDIAVSTSLSEGLPFNIMEAMACALPVAASRVKGHADLVEDGVNGLLFDSGSADQLADCLKRLYDEAGLRESLGKAGRDKVRGYSLEEVFPEIMEIYGAVL